jgi:V/A-type H+-transporting ATPase subunit E
MEKIQELTEKIYREGVEKGQAEADRIIEEAKNKAEQIIAEAREQAKGIEAQAQKKAAELDANTKSELKLYTSQALNALKSEIVNVLTDKVSKDAAAGLAADKDFLGQFAVMLASKWSEGEAVVLSSSEADSLKSYFSAKAKELLDKGVTINKVNGKETMLSISPADGSYKVDFGKEEFEAYFKNFLRPQLVEMLF